MKCQNQMPDEFATETSPRRIIGKIQFPYQTCGAVSKNETGKMGK
jgi:hypothetical protein